MKTALKVTAGMLAALVFSASVAYILVSADINSVLGFSVAQRTVTTQKLKWQKTENVSGYKIYQKNAKSNDYTLIKTVKSGSNTKCTVSGLDMETYYYFKISCFRNIAGFEKESKLSQAIKTCTLPRGEDFKDIIEKKNETVKAVWSAAINCNGYELQYAKDKNFTDANTIEVAGVSNSSKEITNLQALETYYFRIRSYIVLDQKRIYSDWSEVRHTTITPELDLDKVDPNKPMIALTFDDGPDYASASNNILKVLKKYKARATFFTVGANAKANPTNMQTKVKLGCEIGNHTFDHKHYGVSVSANDISKCSDVIESVCGIRPTVFRSTGGYTTSIIRNECKREGMSLFYWTIDTEDWKNKNVKKIYKAAMQAKDGDIVLMHDIYSSTANAVKKIVPALIKKGYQLVTVSELIEAKTNSKPQAGTQYVSAEKTN